MSQTIQALADWVAEGSGLEVKVQGDPDYIVSKLSTIDDAVAADITFLANPKYKKHLEQCQAGCVILSSAVQSEWSGNAIILDNPYAGFALVAQKLDTTPIQTKEIHPSAEIHRDATIEDDVAIGPNVVVEAGAIIGRGAQIGAGCFIGRGTIVGAGTRLWPNVSIYHDVKMGRECLVQANTVIGADGFGYAPLNKDGNQHWLKIPQIGGVTIGDYVEIGASTTIDRGAINDTSIGDRVIIDNQVQIAHNVEIGDFTVIAGCTAIAGSTVIGKNVTIGGGCSIVGHISICDRAYITGRAFVMKDIKEPDVYSSGMPATTNKEWRKNTARYRKLDELFGRVKELEKRQP